MSPVLLGRRVLVLALPLALATAAFAQGPFTPGAPGLGDPLYPLAGNGGYDALHYDLTLAWEPATNRLDAVAVLSAVATQKLSAFDLDLRGFAIADVEVDGAAAAFERQGQELVITPGQGIVTGQRFEVRVTYAGEPTVQVDPEGYLLGWIPTKDGAFVACQPDGAPDWFPCNDNPRDKATFDISVTVPEGLTAVANGLLLSSTTSAGRTTWAWRCSDPMAPYLATATIGVFDVTRTTLPGGLESFVAVDPHLGKSSVLDRLPEMVAYFESVFGPYPLESVGAIVDDAKFVFYSLETQTKPLFSRSPDEATLAHELSHMWYGDSVTLTEWTDIWLHEGFATFAEWLWSEHVGGKTAEQHFHSFYQKNGAWIWEPPAGAPGSQAELFAYSVYLRGGMTLQALRQKVGDPIFFDILRDFATEHRHGNVFTADFVAIAERESGLDLTDFFDVWLYRPEKPLAW